MNEGLTRFLSSASTNCYAFGKSRDDHIVKLIKRGRLFTRKQIEQVIMTNRKSSKRIAQHALKRLCEQERIKKKVFAPQLPTVYYVGKRPIHVDHTLLINEVYCSLLTQKPPGVTLEWEWSYLILGGKAIADAMFTIITGTERRVFFLEIERFAEKRFYKDSIYQSIYDADWVNEEWSVIKNNTAIFPTILVVTEDKLSIKGELNFIVASIEQVQKDVYGLIRR